MIKKTDLEVFRYIMNTNWFTWNPNTNMQASLSLHMHLCVCRILWMWIQPNKLMRSALKKMKLRVYQLCCIEYVESMRLLAKNFAHNRLAFRSKRTDEDDALHHGEEAEQPRSQAGRHWCAGATNQNSAAGTWSLTWQHTCMESACLFVGVGSEDKKKKKKKKKNTKKTKKKKKRNKCKKKQHNKKNTSNNNASNPHTHTHHAHRSRVSVPAQHIHSAVQK